MLTKGNYMSRRTTGTLLICLSGLLYAVNFLAAAIYGSGQATWNDALFRSLLQYTDQGLTTASIAALAVGVIYLIWAELSQRGSGSDLQ
jgi:hypothetical protein